MIRTLADAGLDDSDRKLLQDIVEFGWHVVLIPEEGGVPGWAFSVGLYQTFKHPEAVVFGLPLGLSHHVINAIGISIKAGKSFESGQEYPELLEGVQCMFRSAQSDWYRPFLGYATWYYRGIEFPVLQCLWPDKQQRYPWEPGFKMEYLDKQPWLFEKDAVAARAVDLLRSTGDWKFADPPNVATFTTRQVVIDRQPILLVTHDEGDGAWQFHSEGPAQASDLMMISLAHMLQIDPSLVELANLPVGWQARRLAVSEPWQRSLQTEE